MYAIFEDGSRQYRVRVGETVKVDYRAGAVGDRVEFPRVLLYRGEGDVLQIGQPTLAGMRVVGEVVDFPSTKVQMVRFRRRKNVRKRKGHRQWYTAVKVSHILQPGQDAPPPARPAAASTTAASPADSPAS